MKSPKSKSAKKDGAATPKLKPKSKSKGASRASPPPNPGPKAKAPPVAGANTGQATGEPASGLIDQRVRDLGGWRGPTLARVRALILEADPEMIEEWKWANPVWSRHGIVCTGEAYTKVVKLTFPRGASIPDPSHLFNSSLTGNTRRAIDIHEGERLDARAFKALIKAAVAQNGPPPKAGAKARPSAKVAKTTRLTKAPKSEKRPVVLLSGGNPQIAKADGDAPVQAYITAMPLWKSGLGKRLDALIVRNVPNVRKAVKWNSPFYGIEGQGWFLTFHVLTRYVKVTFFQGTSLRPVPPGGTPKSKEARWIDIHEDDKVDEAQMATWVKQAAALPGWVP